MSAVRPPALEISGVTQRFSLRHEKTLRGLFVTKVLRRHATKETFTALGDLNLTVSTGTTVGLIGHNGSGKSTLLKIIGGVLTPTTGEVRRRGTLAALLELGAGFHHDLTGRENVYLNAEVLGIPRRVARERFDEIVEFSGVGQFIDTPMKFYSSGMFVRLGFAVAIYAEPDILLVDEVLAVGDEAFQRKCLDVIRRFQEQGRTIVLVTHDMRQVEEFCDRVVLLDHGRVVSDGEPGRVIADFRELLGHPEMENRQAPPVMVSAVEVEAATHAELTSVSITADFTGHAEAFEGRVEISSDAGGLLFAGGSGEAGSSVQMVYGRRRLQFEFTDLPLAGGRYRVLVSARRPGAERSWHTDRSGGFEVLGPEVGAPLIAACTMRELSRES